jgi:hypothetical protein
MKHVVPTFLPGGTGLRQEIKVPELPKASAWQDAGRWDRSDHGDLCPGRAAGLHLARPPLANSRSGLPRTY